LCKNKTKQIKQTRQPKNPKNKFNEKAKELYNENYNPFMKEIQKIVKNGKVFCAHRLEESILLKCPQYIWMSLTWTTQ
jgi:hypothetical protein